MCSFPHVYKLKSIPLVPELLKRHDFDRLSRRRAQKGGSLSAEAGWRHAHSDTHVGLVLARKTPSGSQQFGALSFSELSTTGLRVRFCVRGAPKAAARAGTAAAGDKLRACLLLNL